MFRRLRQWWERRHALRHFGCALWCPTCSEELHYHASCDDSKESKGGIVWYRCACGSTSKWAFGIAPVPLLMDCDDLGLYGKGTPRPLSELRESYDRLFRRDS